jgi:fructosamine-3-kinase
MALWNAVARAVTTATARTFQIGQLAPMMGGRVSNAFIVSDGSTRYFVKTQNEARVRGYAWEARSLRTIAAAGVAAPAVIATGQHGTRSFMVLEFIEPAPPP